MMASDEVLGNSVACSLPGKCGRNVGNTIVRVIGRVATRAKDVRQKCIRGVNGAGRIVDKLRLTLHPFLSESLFVCSAERPDFQITNSILSPGQFGLSGAPAAGFRDGTVVFRTKVVTKMAAPSTIGKPVGYGCQNDDGDDSNSGYLPSLQILHDFLP